MYVVARLYYAFDSSSSSRITDDDALMEAKFYDYESRSIPPFIYSSGAGGRGGILMTELAMFAGHRSAVVGAGSLTSWPFDCYQKRSAAPPARGLGLPAGAFSIDCLLTGRHSIDDASLQLRPSTENLNLLHIGKLARNTDIDG